MRWKRLRRLFDWSLARALARADAVWGVDPRTPPWVQARFPRLDGRVFAQEVWADPEIFRPGTADERRVDRAALRRRLGLGGQDRIAMLAGRLELQKDPVLLVDALAEIAPDEPRLFVLFVGRGRLERAISRRAEALGLAPRVRWLDPMSREELAAIYRGTDLTVCCSAYESGPRSVFESLACGCPAVTFDLGQVARVLSPLSDLGLLVTDRGAGPLAGAIRRALALGDEPRVATRCAAAAGAFTPENALRPRYRRYAAWLETGREP